MKRNCLVAVMVCFVLVPLATNAQQPAPPDLVKKAAAATVVIVGLDENGVAVGRVRGFFITPNLVLAEFRPLKLAVTMRATLSNGMESEVILRGCHSTRSVALFSVADAGIEPLKSGSAGDQAFVVLENGSMDLLPILRGDRETFIISPPASIVPDADSWGRPAFDAVGDVVGICTSSAHVIALSSLGALRYALPAAGDTSPPPPPTETDSKYRIVGGVAAGTLATVPGDRRDPEPPRVIRKSTGVLQGEAVRRAEPLYPPLAKAARLSGSVPVEIIIDEEGEVVSARALAGHPLFKDAAVAAAQAWRFKPTLLAGTPVKVVGTITFNFSL